MHNAIDWNDLRLVLAVAREGSLSGAARRLGVTHSTVFRRLGAIEATIGTRLFERFRDGYAPTPAGETAAASAARLEDRCSHSNASSPGRISGRQARSGSRRRIRSARS
ncbi:LysR family transcriptional regulator [Bradyrhizobium sp. ISRA443]|uniref:helix-turn-helix domain-containing protein n=1 Tax=unclassified Bradyrhizobium TaxID=2631580 RepID=UPI00247882CA|nr:MULTISPECIES: LysR family transcriptional regulator [unclassified Bradyrhizobium]WGR92444.1 LysR family transcriptional regulator [Bradyrhizobium sp. ISRA435]WGR96814.1 LysR family transcriptional regulator [Bradyrhizobium sp. ISRA436]WGS03702.1 LysR family transcriptional regulator [Bradyrhizobium sp. ISRA437]WGS10586.1 LysR family transcriptional regulator [Bradyrhizobium sp. ISRA443]